MCKWVCVCANVCLCVLSTRVHAEHCKCRREATTTTYIQTHKHAHTRSRRQLFVYEKYARNWQNVDKLITCMLCELRRQCRCCCQRERAKLRLKRTARECAHEDSAERARTMCALRVGERFTVWCYACASAWHCINIELGSWWRSVPASFCRRHRAHWLHTGQVVTQIRKYT